MRARLLHLWDRLRASYWFVPTLMALGAVGLALFCLAIDAAVPDISLQNSPFLYVAEADDQRSLLLSVGTVTLGTAGVVFSLTTVPLTVAASQFGSRLLRNFLRDQQTQVVLGTYFGTFVYCMAVLFAIPNKPVGQSLPHISTTVSLFLALASLCLLIFFIHHIAVSLQAPTVIAEVSAELHQAIHRFTQTLCPTIPLTEAAQEDAARFAAIVHEHGVPLPATRSGYVQFVDLSRLVAQAEASKLVFYLCYQPGDFVVAGDILGYAWPPEEVPRPVETAVEMLNGAFIQGAQRIPTQDVESAVNQLVEVAVRALSPAINDPFTAITCLDRLGVALREIAHNHAPSPYRYDELEKVRVIHPVVTLDRLCDAAFHLIRQYGRGNAEVLVRLLDTLATVYRGIRRDSDRAVVRSHADLVLQEADSTALTNPWDRARVRQHYQRLFPTPETVGKETI
ncbi:MAG: DUF2254 domain-containing protein [Armatimonadaceae bacterium]